MSLKVDDLRVLLQQSSARWIADVTSLSDLSEPEKRLRLGATHPNGVAGMQQREATARRSHAEGAAAAPAPTPYPQTWDWRDVRGGNFITPIRDQGHCGSCVAFGSIAATEAMMRIQQNNPDLPVDLSEAHLFYCDAIQYDHTNCHDGWWPIAALGYLTRPGVCDEACFPYTPGDQDCRLCQDWPDRATSVTSFHTITDQTAMKTWLAKRGPLISVFAVYDDIYYYRSGVYHHVTGAYKGAHCICVIGYDDSAQCWICKNSWGPGWGEAGFFRIAYGECGIDADMWAIEGVRAPNKTTLSDTSRVTPGLAVIGSNIALAWTGTDSPSHLNVMTSTDGINFGGKVILNELSFDGPAVASSGGRLFIAWAGTDHHLNVMSSTDCRHFGGKHTLGDTAAFGPALAYMNGHLYLAWVGTDSVHHLNVMSSADDGTTWGNKVTLGETSDSQIGLCAAQGKLYLIWQGTDSDSSINFLESTDGRAWSNKITLRDSSDHTPAAVLGKELVLAWTGRDSIHSLNRMLSTTGSHGFGDKLIFRESATAGVALAVFGNKVYIAWGGTDAAHHLNVMWIPG
jgi:C1A family cysteine protease